MTLVPYGVLAEVSRRMGIEIAHVIDLAVQEQERWQGFEFSNHGQIVARHTKEYVAGEWIPDYVLRFAFRVFEKSTAVFTTLVGKDHTEELNEFGDDVSMFIGSTTEPPRAA